MRMVLGFLVAVVALGVSVYLYSGAKFQSYSVDEGTATICTNGGTRDQLSPAQQVPIRLQAFDDIRANRLPRPRAPQSVVAERTRDRHRGRGHRSRSGDRAAALTTMTRAGRSAGARFSGRPTFPLSALARCRSPPPRLRRCQLANRLGQLTHRSLERLSSRSERLDRRTRTGRRQDRLTLPQTATRGPAPTTCRSGFPHSHLLVADVSTGATRSVSPKGRPRSVGRHDARWSRRHYAETRASLERCTDRVTR